MRIFQQWRQKRFTRQFTEVGPDCVFNADYLEIKGNVTLGARCTLANNVLMRTHKRGFIVLGDDVSLAEHVMIASNERIEIGANTRIEAYCVLRDINHTFHANDVHWRLTPHQTDEIRIGENCFIGAHSYIMPGVTMGNGAVVLPRSMVTKDIGENEIWAGTPQAQKIGHRTDEAVQSKLKRHQYLLCLYGFEAPAPENANPEQ